MSRLRAVPAFLMQRSSLYSALYELSDPEPYRFLVSITFPSLDVLSQQSVTSLVQPEAIPFVE
jgi:hypothetical protein